MLIDQLPTDIVRYPDPCLRRKSVPIETFDESLGALAQRMFELMQDNRGVGLAAPQVGINLRMFVCNPTGEPGDNVVFVNPELSDLSGVLVGEEGCLSLPDVRVLIRRARQCDVTAQDVTGQPIRGVYEDLMARIIQHENDHLEGQLIVDRMDGSDRIANRKAITQLEKEFRA
jgi:peptide deformylase